MTEPLDANKSELTHAATAAVAVWLDGIGCKPVETEVTIGDGWVADLATFWCPTFTEAKKSRLLREVCGDIQDDYYKFKKLSRIVAGRITIAVEVKVSRSDFLRDVGRKYGMRQDGAWKRASLPRAAHCCIVACPKSVMKDDELRLQDWGWLELSENCQQVRKWHGAWGVQPIHPGQIEDFIAAVAIRRDHHTRYASIRRALKMYRGTKRARQ